MSMKIVRPTAITDSNFVSSSTSEADHAAWNPATAYVIGDRVIVTTGYHRIYERLVDGTTATHPSLDTANWFDVGPTNRWAMFDEVVGTVTTATSPLEVVVTPGRVNSLALLGLSASTVTVVMDSTSEGEVYNQEFTLEDSAIVADWYAYFFEPINLADTLVVTDLPVYGDGEITVTIEGSSTVEVGLFLVGASADLGLTQYGARAGIIDYSRKVTDEFGRTSLLQRAFSNRMDLEVFVEGSQTDAVKRLLTQFRATACLWIGADEYSSLVVYGFYRDFEVQIVYATASFCTLSIEGLT